MPQVRPETFWLNEPAPPPIVIFVLAVVGLLVVAYTIPLSVIAAPPSLVVLPPSIALVAVILVAVEVESVAVDGVLKLFSSP